MKYLGNSRICSHKFQLEISTCTCVQTAQYSNTILSSEVAACYTQLFNLKSKNIQLFSHTSHLSRAQPQSSHQWSMHYEKFPSTQKVPLYPEVAGVVDKSNMLSCSLQEQGFASPSTLVFQLVTLPRCFSIHWSFLMQAHAPFPQMKHNTVTYCKHLP